jgi:hypothetical protein
MYLVNRSNEMLHENQPDARRLRLGVLGLLIVLAIAFVVTAGRSNASPVDLDWISQLANSGEPDAQLQLGLAYRDGRYGLAADPKIGLYWLKQAAQHGNVYAEDAVGVAYARGQGVAPDPLLAKQWLRKAMHDGNDAARIHLSENLIQAGHLHQAEQLLL